MARIAWILNLDADLELAALAAGRRSYAPKQSVREAMGRFVPILASSLLDPDDVLLDDSAVWLTRHILPKVDSAPATDARGLPGRAFCPTPRALHLLRGAGAEPEPHPSAHVLVHVSSRAFASGLGPTLPRGSFVTDLAAARALLDSSPAPFDAWRVKRAFGMSGRGQRVVAPRTISAADIAFVKGGLAQGGVRIEPDVSIVCEYAIHGMLSDAGALRLGAVVRQRCDARGAWIATERLEPGVAAERAVETELIGQASSVARALSEAGYFGPFGVDAFTYDGRDGSTRLQPRSEVNARYTMGFAVGFAR